jgi:two-component system sensor histidine kinase YesM
MKGGTWGMYNKIVLPVRNFFQKVSYQHKLFLIMCITVLFISIFNYGYLYSVIKNRLYASAYDNLAVSTDQLANNITAKLEYFSGLSNTIYSDYQVMQLLTNEYVDPGQYVDFYQFIGKYIQRFMAADPYILSITFYIDSNKIPPDMKYIKPIEQLEGSALFDDVNEARGGIVYGPASRWEETTVGESSSGTGSGMSYSFKLVRLLNYYTYGSNYGILSIDIDTRDLRRMFENELNNKDIFIVDAEGAIIVSGNSSHTSRKLVDVVDMEMTGLKDRSYTTIFFNGEQKLTTCRQLKNGWRVVALTSYTDVVRNINQSLLRMFVVSLVILGLSFFAFYVISYFFTRKVKYLIRLIKNVESGDFDIKVINAGDDELGKVISAFSRMAKKVNHLMKEVYEKEIIGKSTELELLQAQINPHFLYNTLSSMAALARRYHDERLTGMVISLSDFYRISLNKGRKIITVREEIDLTRSYLRIMMYRFEGLIHSEIHCEPQVMNYVTPKFILQPFVENSINHGISGDEGIRIFILAEEKEDKLIFTITDDGCGMTPDVIEKCLNGPSSGRGYGIRNVQQRIAMLYGDSYGIDIDSSPGKGAKVTIYLPLIRQ